VSLCPVVGPSWRPAEPKLGRAVFLWFPLYPSKSSAAAGKLLRHEKSCFFPKTRQKISHTLSMLVFPLRRGVIPPSNMVSGNLGRKGGP